MSLSACPRRGTVFTLGVLVSVGLTGCGHPDNDTRSATAGLPDIEQQLTANPWILDHGASSPRTARDGAITIRFGPGGLVSGTTSCGAYRARFTVDEEAVTVRQISRTFGRCPPHALRVQRAYLAALGLVDKVAPTGRDHLQLEGSAHTKLSYDVYNPK